MKLLTLWRALREAERKSNYFYDMYSDLATKRWTPERAARQQRCIAQGTKYEQMVLHLRKRLESQMAIMDEVL